MSSFLWRASVGAMLLFVSSPVLTESGEPPVVSYSLACGPDSCLIHSTELSFAMVRVGHQVALKPLTFTPRLTGPLSAFGTIAASQFRVVPDDLYPRGGHYLVGPGDDVLEWKREGDSLSHLTLGQFLDRIRRTKFVYISVGHLVSRDVIGGDERQLRTSSLVSAIERAQARLPKRK